MPFSFSQLSTYRTCPKQYEFACIKKIPRSISAGESFGSSVHNTFSKWGKLEVERGKRKTENSQLTLFTEADETFHFPLSVLHLVELWHQSFIVQGYDSKSDADQAREKGERLMHMFFEWWSKSDREVVAIEKGFSIEIDVNIIKGRFDRVEESEEGVQVIDYKTGSIRNQEEVDKDLQLSIYAIASEELFGKPCTELLLLFLHEDGIKEVRTSRSKDQLTTAKEEISSLSEGIDEGMFDSKPAESNCRRCPYRSICADSVV